MFVWAALLAVFGFALGPTVSHFALPAFADGGAGHDVCSATHTGAPSPQPDDHQAPSGLDCCGLCAVAASAFTVPMAAGSALPAPATAAALTPRLRADAPPGRDLFASASPRGPPSA